MELKKREQTNWNRTWFCGACRNRFFMMEGGSHWKVNAKQRELLEVPLCNFEGKVDYLKSKF